ncbi:maltose alpha-D-glucosyltransferase [Rhizobium sp. VS19-DR104.2]|uniref:maltose alpha-D-glucosyltransferase n=1 Tax=unclassified Rhizobium TaxID=2613769 RepID=UPI001ADA2D37|nr:MULTISPECIES: maltose alpha-D-glucosyltransferase [unclassified Rhizobium]MBO9100816.1 maltose alpha-D-glucosyltransferase [Rhizobium sp. L58/93]MBZ5763304.1 maltose alpha-D-glucosyltransferase [Rhizobium sp. VS19-DR96]MBZ5769192.1 maltose alpha-D-glucosyltransferase [Rhizobium sp. VS19-DR129.2]MBZ5776745.1 maltose alpha-D-glucosyltransferase [Rhizobium sp. VS19-DRK62.2]MBZ5787915.1 maltose alpha-D-glucosyltransferase [Rhizobium sp. VS19-DR121]
MGNQDTQYTQKLRTNSMLAYARERAALYGGKARMWQRRYGEANPRSAAAIASVWFSAYPSSIITDGDGSVLAALGDAKLWSSLSNVGIKAIHIGPTKQAGGWRGDELTPSVDGHFDRIGVGTDPAFGTQEEFVNLGRMAAAFNAVVLDDVIPGHTGKGPDFRLAERAYEDYPGLYHMVEIAVEDWGLLPEVEEGKDAANLGGPAVDALCAKGYIVGHLQRVIFFEPGVKETDWSATPPVLGVDGVERRWVYLHYFKEGQPSLNWLDPSFAAQQMIVGDALHSIDVLGARGLRLDANGFLGVEGLGSGKAWSEGHPLSVVGNQLLAGVIRKAGAFSFQELNLAVDDIATMSKGGADLSYDFVTRPAYHHALLTGDTEFLRMMLRTVHEFGIDPASLIHALQNHDELTLELVHFWTLHADDIYTFQGQTWQGRTLRTHLRETMYERLSGAKATYNQKFVTNGVSCTTASVIAAALNIEDLTQLSDDDVELIKKVHLLLAMYNAFQPGIFALSGWDIVGALPLPIESVGSLVADGDTRWIHRGAYDLMGTLPHVERSSHGLPRAKSLYGSLADQLEKPGSFASQLKKLLSVREAYGIAMSRQIAIPDVHSPGLLIMVHELPEDRGTQITALNFGNTPISEIVKLENQASGPVIDMIHETIEGDLPETGELTINLEPYEGLSLRVVAALPTLGQG